MARRNFHVYVMSDTTNRTAWIHQGFELKRDDCNITMYFNYDIKNTRAQFTTFNYLFII